MTTTYYTNDGSIFTLPANSQVIVEGTNTTVTYSSPCTRCGGAGGWKGWPGFTCYRCGGQNSHRSEISKVRVYTADQVGKVVARNAKAAATREAKADAKHQASLAVAQSFLAANGIESAWPLFTAPSSEAPRAQVIVQDIVGKLVKFGSISPAQIALVAKLTAELAAPKVEAVVVPVPVTDERVQVVGKVVSLKTVEGQFGTTLKMLVVSLDGWKVFGAVPSSIHGVERGDQVSFQARIERSGDDAAFGFFSRPTKATLVEAAA